MLVALFQIDITSTLNRFAGDEDEDVGNTFVANKIFFLSLLWNVTILLTIVISDHNNLNKMS